MTTRSGQTDVPAPARRIASLRERMKTERIRGFLVSARPNVRYLTGFTGSSGLLLVTSDSLFLFTDGRYGTQVRQQTSGIKIVVAKGDPLIAVAAHARKVRLSSLALEADRLLVSNYEYLRGELSGRRLKPVRGWVEELRMVKSQHEIERIRRSAEINSRAFERALRRLRPSWTEARLAAEIEHQMRILGAQGPAFDTIVASGPRSALPHAQPAQERLEANSLVVIDQGAILDGYASDMTRVVCLGRLDRRKRQLFQAVCEAHQEALGSVKAGVSAGTVDRRARRVLRQHGLAKCFTHSTGHGVGLEIHEAPRIGTREKRRLQEGMVITIEPGAYLEGVGGARVEDLVAVTRNGCDNLTRTPKELRIL